MAENQPHKPDKSWLTPDKVARLASAAKTLELGSRTRPSVPTPAQSPVSAPADRLRPQPRSESLAPQRPAPRDILPPPPAPIPPAPVERARPFNPKGENFLDWVKSLKKPAWLKISNINVRPPSERPWLSDIKKLGGLKPAWAIAAACTLAVAAGTALVMRNSSAPHPDDVRYSQPGDVPQSGTGPAYVPPTQNTPRVLSVPPAPVPSARVPQTSRQTKRAPIEMELPAGELSGLSSPLDAYELTERQSRGFGNLIHPILKKMKNHDGVDFKAPMGTPVYAVSDGVIEESGWEDGYGKTIRLAHSRSTQSLYAHLSNFAKGIKPGTKVKKDDLIGYVGATGQATGPHLHFEIRHNDVPLDPRKIAREHAQAVDMHNSLVDPELRNLMSTSAAREDLNPQLILNLFAKEARDLKTGGLNVNAVSDKGASGPCQFTGQTFLMRLKQHGYRLGFSQYANQIDYSQDQNGRTKYTAGKNHDEILNLRFNPAVAIPVCAAHIKDDLKDLQAYINRPLTIADSATSHFTGWFVAKDIIRAYDNPKFRNDPAYMYATKANYAGSETNMMMFFKGGDPKKPYSVAEFYENKVSIVGNAPAFMKDIRQSNTTMAQNKPG